jgi:hypothetical protein
MVTHSNSEISFLVDTMIVETLLADDGLSKTAQAGGVVSNLITKVKGYIGNQINPDDKAGSLLNLIAPGAISMAFKAMGFGWLGILFGLALRIFHIDVAGILESIYGKIKSLITGDKQTTSQQVDEIVSSSVQEHVKPATEDEANQAAQALNASSSQLLRDAKFLKLAMVEFEESSLQMTKEAGLLSLFSSRKGTTVNLLVKVLGWIFKVALASAGLMVAGDVINKFLGRPNALDGSVQRGRPVGETSAPAAATPVVSRSTQTRFKPNPSYRNTQYNTSTTWIENMPNNDLSIETMLVNFAKEVYQGLDGLEATVRASPVFQVVKDRIVQYNRLSQGDNWIMIPNYFTSKKQIVDFFIDDVAEAAGSTPTPPTTIKA